MLTGTASRQHALRRTLAVGLPLLLLVAIVVSAMLGQVLTGPGEVIGSVLRAVGIANDWAPSDPLVENTLWLVRFPRIAMGVGVGAALAVSGAAMQAVFGNPLAEPGVVGVSSGAALGAAAAIVALPLLSGTPGRDAAPSWLIAGCAFLGALLTAVLVYLVSRADGRTEVTTLLLTGIAINAFAGAGIAFLLFLANTSSREQIVFWQLGSLNGSLWPQALLVAAVMLLGSFAAWLLGNKFDVLSLGERSARQVGVAVERLRLASILLVALLTGVAVAFAGIIAFVGLVVPHIVRMAIGPAHRPLILASACGGAILLVVADLFARTLIRAADLPIGMLTSLVGGPFFFYLLIRQRRGQGGWA